MSDISAEVRDRLAAPPPRVAKAVREEAGVSQERLARELGVHRVTLARWESGEHEPRAAARARWATVIRSLRDAVEGAA
jgi:transcriptional regulator with XRE-family HTH domain